MGNRLYGKIVCWSLGVFCALPLVLFAQPLEENVVKGAFVYNFILFTEWPATAFMEDETINICISSRSPMAPSLAVLEGKPVKKMHLSLRRMGSLKSGLSSCHILYLDRLDRQAWGQIKNMLGDRSILTISDDGEINANGVMIALSSQGNRIVFDIDKSAAQKSRLLMSSKLLRLARTVR
jgi:hypothetical protein